MTNNDQPMQFTCQQCQKTFSSFKGLRIHQGKTMHAANVVAKSPAAVVGATNLPAANLELMRLQIERERLELERSRMMQDFDNQQKERQHQMQQQEKKLQLEREQQEKKLQLESEKAAKQLEQQEKQMQLESDKAAKQMELERAKHFSHLEHDSKQRCEDRQLDKYKFDLDLQNKKDALDKKLKAYMTVEHERNETMKEVNNTPRMLLVGPRTANDIYQPKVYGTIGRPYYDYSDMNRMIESCPIEGQRSSFKSIMQNIKETVEVKDLGEIDVVAKDVVDYVSHSCTNAIKGDIGEERYLQQYHSTYDKIVPHVAKKEPIKNVIASFSKLLDAAGIDADGSDPASSDQLDRLNEFKVQCNDLTSDDLDRDFTFNFIVRNDIVTFRIEEHGLVLTDASYRYNADQDMLVAKGVRKTLPDKQSLWEKDYGRSSNYGQCKGCNKAIHRDDCERCHVVPQSKGGSNYPHNVVMQCRDCNQNMRDSELTMYNVAIA